MSDTKTLGRSWIPFVAVLGDDLLHVSHGATETHCGKPYLLYVGASLVREPFACVPCRRKWNPVLLLLEDVWQQDAAQPPPPKERGDKA